MIGPQRHVSLAHRRISSASRVSSNTRVPTTPPVQAVYGVLKEAEHRSTFYIPYWNIPITKYVVPRQVRAGRQVT
jgi:hypothetical protein